MESTLRNQPTEAYIRFDAVKSGTFRSSVGVYAVLLAYKVPAEHIMPDPENTASKEAILTDII